MDNKNACQVIFHAEGFNPQTDLPDMHWELIKSEFVTMYNAFASATNSMLERINHIWENYEYIKLTNNIASIFECEMAMGILDYSNITYEDWIEKNYNEIVEAVNAGMSPFFHLTAYIFRDGNSPTFRAKIKDHDDWTIYITLEPIHEEEDSDD